MNNIVKAIRVSLIKGLAGNSYEIRSLPRPHYKLVEYAERELPKAGDDEWQKLINDNILEMLTVFSNQGHSGTSAAYVRARLDKLLDWKPLSPLTGEEDEWIDGYKWSDNSSQQNKRCFSVFKDKDGRAYDISGYVFRDPGGGAFTCRMSYKPVTFPYVPSKEYVNLPENNMEFDEVLEVMGPDRPVYDSEEWPYRYPTPTPVPEDERCGEDGGTCQGSLVLPAQAEGAR